MGWHVEEEKPRLAMVTLQYQVKRGKAGIFQAAATSFAQETQRASGCLSCACYPGTRSGLSFQLVTIWRSRADFESYRRSPRAEQFFSGPTAALLAREPKVTVWEAEE